MKIGIDARFVGPQGTGLGKYTEKLIENLQEIDQKNDYVIFLRKGNWDYLKFKNKNFKKIEANVPWYSVEEQIKLPKIFKSQNLDVLHVPHFNAPMFYNSQSRRLFGLRERSKLTGKFIVTIHDLIHHNVKEQATTTKNPVTFRIKRFAYKKVIENAVKKSQKIIVPTSFTKKEILNNFKIDAGKIAITSEAAEEEYLVNQKPETRNQKLLEKFSIRKPFLIYVGNAYPHKNLEKLLKAAKILAQNPESKIQNLNLVIVSARGIFTKRLESKIKELGIEKNVTLTGYISAQELPAIFKQAEAYVFPTLSEGFGIPGLNAMASGLPVICSNIPTLKEVYEDAAIYFDPSSEKDMAEKINKVLKDKKLKDSLIEKGSKQAKKYSWRKMAQETLKVYEGANNLSN